MKSAYEKAMEKLEEESGPLKKLSDEQREQIAAIEKKYDAQAAETRLNYEQRIASADRGEAERLKAHMQDELAKIEELREQKRQTIWNEAGE
ncbi:MAG: hypothetical protein ACLFU6_05205 [Candidatus Hydrogenedentota bacterium]